MLKFLQHYNARPAHAELMKYTHFDESISQYTFSNITYLSFRTNTLTYLFRRPYQTALLSLAERYGHYKHTSEYAL
jgi:hypothetical protein